MSPFDPRRCLWPSLILAGLLPSGYAAENNDPPGEPLSKTAAMSARVDELLSRRWQAARVEPAPLSHDAEFLRRANLDLCGSIPSVAEVRAFLSDTRPDKRAALIDALLQEPDHATHLADTWRNFLLPGEVDEQRAGGVRGFEIWLRNQFVRNKRYDNVVAELLVAEGRVDRHGETLFYTALESKPEELAANTSRIFLGVQIQCAQCHDHPFNNWKQGDFWGYAAFFARVKQQNTNVNRRTVAELVSVPTGEVKLPDSDQVVPPKFLGSDADRKVDDESRRSELAIWLASASNPFFARATVNRVWGQLFGRGLVEPVDDLGSHNPPSHPELLDEMSTWFIDTGFDLRELYRMLTNTRAYQLTSRMTSEDEQTPPELFARMSIKSLSAEQLYDALSKATLRRLPEVAMGSGVNRFEDPERRLFVGRFRGIATRPTEFQAGIPQALTLMNGQSMTAATAASQSPLLESLAAPFFSDEERVEVLFLATLSRLPHADERAAFVEHVAAGAAADKQQQGLSDVLWALLNSAEFALNH